MPFKNFSYISFLNRIERNICFFQFTEQCRAERSKLFRNGQADIRRFVIKKLNKVGNLLGISHACLPSLSFFGNIDAARPVPHGAGRSSLNELLNMMNAVRFVTAQERGFPVLWITLKSKHN